MKIKLNYNYYYFKILIIFNKLKTRTRQRERERVGNNLIWFFLYVKNIHFLIYNNKNLEEIVINLHKYIFYFKTKI